MSDPSTLEALVRAADGRAALAPLLRALGLTPLPPGSVRAERGSADALAPAVVARSDGLVAVLLELREAAGRERVARLARQVQQREPLHPHLVLAADPGYARLTFAATGLDGAVRQLAVDRRRPSRAELDALAELAARPGETGVALALRHARVLERARVTRRFFRDFRGRRDAIAAAWLGLSAELEEHRDALALLFLSRLMFLYFLQREGHLAGDADYLPRLVRAPLPAPGTIYRVRLEPLFFGALNRRPERRDAAARALGPLPYLNGGLFERHPVERRAPSLELPDAVVLDAFDLLLDRYRFTTRERDVAEEAAGATSPTGAGIDPEMLGRVFEDLMAPARRGATGTFYTPAATVARLTREAVAAYAIGHAGLTAAEAAEVLAGRRPDSLEPTRATAAAERLRSLRLLDPACGSGAFLLGALTRLSRARLALAGGDTRDVRRDIVAHVLHGVDVQADAALLCALRLWLALAERSGPPLPDGPPPAIPPLPNLDLRVRQGDALLDPLDLLAAPGAAPSPGRAVRRAMTALRPLAERYLGAEPGDKETLAERLRRAEADLARAWLGESAARLERQAREQAAAALELDLFGQRTIAAREAERQQAATARSLAEARELERRVVEQGALPFFSFAVHFAGAVERGFDIVLSNPPWLRAGRWPPAVRRLVRARFEVCRAAGWRRGAALGGAPPAAGAQVDLALLFLERALDLLAPGGVLAMVLPAKMLRSLFGAGGRRLLLRRCRMLVLEDHALDQHSLFRADAYAALVVAEKLPAAAQGRDPHPAPSPAPTPPVRVTMVRRRMPPLRFAVEPAELPLAPGDPDAPWLLAPPGARAALRRMQRAPALGDDPALRVRRGVFTAADDVLLLDEVQPKLAGLALVRARGARAGRGNGPPRTSRGRPDAADGTNDALPVDAYEALIETRALAPAVRGSGLGAWSYRVDCHLVWTHDDVSGAPGAAPPRLTRYLERHARRLDARAGAPARRGPGTLLRVTADTLRPKVAWQDLDANLEAVALPARIPGFDGESRPLIPLNTVYFIPVPAAPEALLLAAWLNSLPARTFARAIAERAKDARFRFFAWVVALLPLPADWRSGPSARRLLAISRAAHAAGRIEPDAQAELDALVTARYGLEPQELEELRRFDRWLRGQAPAGGPS